MKSLQELRQITFPVSPLVKKSLQFPFRPRAHTSWTLPRSQAVGLIRGIELVKLHSHPSTL